MDTNGVCVSRDTAVTFASPLPSRYSSERGCTLAPGSLPTPVVAVSSLLPEKRGSEALQKLWSSLILPTVPSPGTRLFPAEAVRGCPPPRDSTRSLLSNSFSQHWKALRSLCYSQHFTRTECTSSAFPWAHVHASVGRRDHRAQQGPCVSWEESGERPFSIFTSDSPTNPEDSAST